MAFNRSETNSDVKTSKLPWILGLVGLFLIFGMAAMIAFYPFHYNALNADVKKVDDHFDITNNTDYDWKDVRLLLNTDYKLNTPIISAHGMFSPILTDFKKDDGTKFNAYYQVNDLYITAVTPEDQTISNIFKFSP